jgi:hypothetical protein
MNASASISWKACVAPDWSNKSEPEDRPERAKLTSMVQLLDVGLGSILLKKSTLAPVDLR